MDTLGIEFRPSAAERWTTCPASVKAVAELPRQPSSAAADEGTGAHWLLEQAGIARMSPHQWLGAETSAPGVHVTEEMAACIEEVLGYITQVVASAPTLYLQHEVPSTIELQGGAPMKGTSDVLALQQVQGQGYRLHVMDLKYGKGIKVQAQGNPQLELYALGAMQRLYRYGVDVAEVVLHIMQPRLSHYPTHTLSCAEILARAATFQQAMKEALSEAPRFVPSEAACRWCAIKATCTARAQKHYAAIAPSFNLKEAGTLKQHQGVRKPDELTEGQLSLVMFDIPSIRDWCNAIEAKVRHIVEHFPDRLRAWKLVAGRKSYHWKDEQQAYAALHAAGLKPEECYPPTPPKLISKAEAERALGRKKFKELVADYVQAQAGTPSLVPDSDPRPAITTASKFGVNQENGNG